MKPKNMGRYAVLAIPVIGLVACSSSNVSETFTGAINPGNGLPFGKAGRILNASQTNAFRGVFVDEAFNATIAEASWVNTTGTSTAASGVFKIVSETVIEMTRGSDTWTFRNQGPDPADPQQDLWLAEAGMDSNPTTLTAVFGQGAAEDASTPATELQSIFFGEIQTPPASVTGITNLGSDLFVISGFETRPAEIAALSASASYSGDAQILARTASDDTAAPILDGSFDIGIDFAASNNPVSGTITGDADAKFGGGSVILTLQNGGAVQSGDNSFTTGFAKTGGTNTAITGFSNTNINGTLYGEDAAEIGFLISGDAAVTGTGTVATTGFGRGTKQ